MKYNNQEIESFLSNIEILYEDGYKKEEFKQVFFNNHWYHYLISSYGRLLNVKYRGFDGKISFMKTTKATNGYEKISISRKGKNVYTSIHILVANAFIDGKSLVKNQVNHKDGNKLNNHYWNLEWTSPKENIIHAENNGLRTHKNGIDVNFTKTETEIIHKVCKLLEKGNMNYKEISKNTGVKYDMIRHIYHRKVWKSISKDYDFSKFKLNNDQKYNDKIKNVKKVCKLLEENSLTLQQIADITGIKFGMVNKIMLGKAYTDISCNYKISNYKSKANKSKFN